MIASVVLALLAFPQPNPLQQRDVPDELNAIAEYHRAAELMRQEPLQSIYRTISRETESFDLDARRKLLPRIDSVYEAVKSGNARPYAVMRVHPSDESVGYADLPYYKWIAHGLVYYSEVLMADGKTNEAFEVLIAVYVMGSKVAYSANLLHNLVGHAVQYIVSVPFDSQLQLLSLPAAESILAKIALPESQNDALKALIIRDSNYIKATSQDSSSVQGWELKYQDLAAIVDLPEDIWWPEVARWSRDAVEDEAGLQAVSPTVFFMAMLKNRALRRLLRLHAHIARFYWLHGRLPLDLSQLGQEDAAIDPLTGGYFEYEVFGDKYDLYSRGFAVSGPIRLKYARTGGTPSDPDDPFFEEGG